jgi:COP9 signalosome complex subunit 7
MIGDTKHASGGNPLDQFVMLAKLATSAGAAEIIKQVLEAPGVYVFSELMDVPSIKDLNGTEFTPYYELLTVFAYGTYKDYLNSGRGLPELTVAQKKKLQHLTIVSLSEQDKCIPYKTLLDELGIGNLRELEDLIIEAIYAEIIQGKLDQGRSLLEVDTTIGRDIRKENLPTISSTLESWCDGCENVLATLQAQVDRANADKTQRLRRKDALEQEILNLKKTVKPHSQEPDEMLTDSREALGIDKTPKKSFKKSGRGKLFK